MIDLETQRTARVEAARAKLLTFELNGSDPRWSSALLDDFVGAVMKEPGGGVGEIFSALLTIFDEFPSELSQEVANFVKDLVVKCFVDYRQSYDAQDWPAFVRRVLSSKATKPEWYLALHAVPPEHMSAELASKIAKGLHATAFGDEAAKLLAA